jgi:hypothetical protein
MPRKMRGSTAFVKTNILLGDQHGRNAARILGVEVLPFPAQWKKFGRAAGPIRNRQMLVEGKPDLVIAFHDDLKNSDGSKNMLAQARNPSLFAPQRRVGSSPSILSGLHFSEA